MLIADCLKSIYYRFEKSNEDPDTDSEDYLVRLEYANAAIDKWENELNIKWKELYGVLTGTLAATGICSDNATTLLSFREPAGVLKIGTDVYTYKRPENIEEEVRLNPTKKIYTVYGSKGAFSVQVYPAIGGTFTLPYRKYATKFTTGAETTPIQMSDPEFIIYDVLTNLYLEDDNNAQATVATQTAGAKMESMKLNNEIDPFNNNNRIPEDDDFEGFGN